MSVDLYTLVKTLHILSATILFGTGLGTAFFFWRAHHSPDLAARLFAARTTVAADLYFTTPAVILQPLTGAWLIIWSGVDWTVPWLGATYALYVLAVACWLPVVALQIRMKRMLHAASRGQPLDEERYRSLYRWWFALGWPAFIGLVIVFYLMVAKPGW